MKTTRPNPKEARNPKPEIGGWSVRSVLECGDLLPLFPSATKSSNKSEHSRPRRLVGAQDLSRFAVRLSALGLCHSFVIRHLSFVVALLILHSALCFRVLGQSYSIDWSTVDGGGGTSTGGVFAVSGTIGQADANQQAMTGGNYSLVVGFWALYALQTPGAPLLCITMSQTNAAIVWWPSPSTGFALQQSTNLNTNIWVTPLETVLDDGTNKCIVVNPSADRRFYRLKK